MTTHPVQRRIRVEDLVRRRAPDEGRRYAASQRRGRIDPNPHQLDAVVFALRRIPEGGCILADEVGLGKTIEAGLIISQLLAEGMKRVLLVVPKALLGQWKAELFDLFGIDARQVQAEPEALRGDGVLIVHRELAGGLKGSSLLMGTDPFDLVVVDEAHEVFSGIYKRYNRHGDYEEGSSKAQTAGRLRDLIRRHRAPVLLLTATPIQNRLTELWGLVQYVDPEGSLLGSIATFRELFCSGGDRQVVEDQVHELRRRLGFVLQRTLRRQAQEFLEVPFTARRAKLQTFRMSADELALYDEISAWLLNPELASFSGNNGHLLLIGFLRRMGSSPAAFAASLENVAERIEGVLADTPQGNARALVAARSMMEDLEEEEEPAEETGSEPTLPPTLHQRLQKELGEVRAFVERIEALPRDSKAQCLIELVRRVRSGEAPEHTSGKVVIFTESIKTQDYLHDLLLEDGVPAEEITLFRGQNTGARAKEAFEVWNREVGSRMPPESRTSRDVGTRLALVDEFRNRSAVFISTEAGAKGLNLQFCETLVNYDLPWNPQRIEQRIGRVHRYGQKNSVTVVNFLAQGNEAHELLFKILSEKLDLFGTVLDASDEVLHESEGAVQSLVSAVGMGLERSLGDIYAGASSMAEVAARLRELDESMGAERAAFDEEQERTADLIENRLDETVRTVFKQYQDTLSHDLADLDRSLDEILRTFLDAQGVGYERRQEPERVVYETEPSEALPGVFAQGGRVSIGRSKDASEGSVLHVGHPLILAAVDEARAATRNEACVRIRLDGLEIPPKTRELVGTRGRAVLSKVRYHGLEPVDHLVWTAVLEDGDDALDAESFTALVQRGTLIEADDTLAIELDEELVKDLVEESVHEDQQSVAASEHRRFNHMVRQLDHYLTDQMMVLGRRKGNLEETAEKVDKRRQRETSSVARSRLGAESEQLTKQIEQLDRQIEKLRAGDDKDYRRWMDQLHERRYRAPEVERLIQFDFIVEDG